MRAAGSTVVVSIKSMVHGAKARRNVILGWKEVSAALTSQRDDRDRGKGNGSPGNGVDVFF